MATEELQAHIEEPKNLKSAVSGERSIRHMAMDPRSGDVASITLGLDDAGTVVDAGFKAFGNGLLIGCLSWLTEWAKGKPLGEIEQVDDLGLEARFELEPVRHATSQFAIQALVEAAQLAKQEIGGTSPEQELEGSVSRLEVVTGAFDASDFGEQLDREREATAQRDSPFDGPRILAGLVARMNNLKLSDAGTYEQELARCRYLDGGLRERIGKELVRIFEERGLLSTTSGGA